MSLAIRLVIGAVALSHAVSFSSAIDAAQNTRSPRVQMVIDALKPALPFPAAGADDTVPERGGDDSKWFVVWPGEVDDTAIVVKANPLHPDTQKLVAKAEEAIQRAVADAERKAQAAYDRALEELKRTGKPTDLDTISLEDEGVAGQRLDAELALTIQVVDPASYEIGSSVPPEVTAGPPGVTWQVVVPPNTFQDRLTTDRRDRFTASEARLFFGPIARPNVNRIGDRPRFAVTVPVSPGGLAVILRGNDALLKQVVASAAWSRITPR
jgi:hypothetical protein